MEISPNPAAWRKLTDEELEMAVEQIATHARLPAEVTEAIGYWRSCRVSVRRAAENVIAIAQARGVRPT